MTKVKYFILFFIVTMLILVFPNISNATTYTYSDTEQGIEWSYKLDSSNNVINLKCNTNVIGAVTIPSTIDGKTVISLEETFQDCAGLQEITIPNTITEIGSSAFCSCTGLKAVIIPDSVTCIRYYAFQDCSGLTSVTLSENLTSIGMSAFEDCTGLKSITIPNSVTVIGNSAFSHCSGLKEVTLSQNLTKISDCTFVGCSGLTSVILPNSVTTIEGDYSNINGAFGDCKNLSKVLIPDTVVSIGIGAFQGCSKLTIYGNDGMPSKEYAETNDIPFDYIANWDKDNTGTDITPPTVENIEVKYTSVMDHYNTDTNMFTVPAGTQLIINVGFSEPVQGTTVPTLTIKFGNAENIKLTEGTIEDSTITYIYTVQSTDKGIMTAVDFSGGNITDAAGNNATLSCPALTIQYHSGDSLYANGSVTNSNNGNNNNSNSGNNSNNNNSGTTNNGASNNNGTSGQKDTTTATGKLPQTGIGIGLISTIVTLICGSMFTYKKYSKLKGI